MKRKNCVVASEASRRLREVTHRRLLDEVWGWLARSQRQPRTIPRRAGVPVSAMRHGRLRYQADDGSSLRHTVPFERSR